MNIYKLHNYRELSELPFVDTRPAAVTVGMFDGVHRGHQHILSLLTGMARQRGLRSVVVTFDQHPRQVLAADDTGNFRITTNEERYALLDKMEVDEVLELHFTRELAQLSACQFFEQVLHEGLHAQLLVLGFDNMFGNKQHSDFDQLRPTAEAAGVMVGVDTAVTVDGIEVSSTRIRQGLQSGDVRQAANLLGYPYQLEGSVVHGRRVGHQLGFPTANVTLSDSGKVLPAAGVYAVRCLLDGKVWNGVANLGPQPTFGLERPTLEVHLFDFDDDLYGQPLTVEFVDRLRDICRFEGIEELKEQLEKDCDAAAHALASLH